MTEERVLDASVVLKWFAPESEKLSAEARQLLDRYRAGELFVTVPSLLPLELLNVAGRRWAWSEEALLGFAAAIEDLDFEVDEPDLGSVAAWVARGLSAYDAAYVALAEGRGIPVVTDDERILGLASGVAVALAEAR